MSWKQPYSTRITNAAAADFATIGDMADRGYATMPPVEETLAEHLTPNSSMAWKSHPLLPSPQEEPSPMAPRRKDWGPRAYSPAHQHQQKGWT